MRFLRSCGSVCMRDAAELDRLLKRKIEMLKRLSSLPAANANDAEFDHELSRLKTAFRRLFEREEILMLRTLYADWETHHRLHESFQRALEVRTHRSELHLCVEWLNQHAFGADGVFLHYLRRMLEHEGVSDVDAIWRVSPAQPLSRIRLAACSIRLSGRSKASE